MILFRAIAVFMIAGGLVFNAHSADISDSHRQAVLDLLEANNVKAAMEQQQAIIVDAVMAPLGNLPCMKGALPELQNLVKKSVGFDAMKDFIIETYANTFTESELKELTAFNESPLGQKMLREAPRLAQAGVEFGQQAMQREQENIQAIILKQIDEDGQCK